MCPTKRISVIFEIVEILIFILDYNDYFKTHEFSMDFRMRYSLIIVTVDESYY